MKKKLVGVLSAITMSLKSARVLESADYGSGSI